MVIMENYCSQENIKELWLKIDHLHLSYLEMEESPEKIGQRTRLEDCIAKFLCVVPHKQKFIFDETEEVLYRSAARKKDFSGYRAATGWNALQLYAGNLLTQPWRKEYHKIQTYCGFYKHQIEANLTGAEMIFEAMGYKHIGNGILMLDGPICPDRVASVSRDCLIAYVECQILKHIWEEVSQLFNISWVDILDYRRNNSGDPEYCIKHFKFRFQQKQYQEQMRNSQPDSFVQKYLPSSPNSQVSMQNSHSYTPLSSHNHVALPLQQGPLCSFPNGCCPNAYSTYAYVPSTPHTSLIKQPQVSAMTPANGYFYTNGFTPVNSVYPVPTAQLIELDPRNGYDVVDAGSTTARTRRSRADSTATLELDRSSKHRDFNKNGLGTKEDEKQGYEEWDYVYRNLESQGYSKDLGERGDVLGLNGSDRQHRHKETKKVKATNLDKLLYDMAVNDRPLKITEALEKMEQRDVEKPLSQSKERRHSQGSSYENLPLNKVPKVIKSPPKVTPSPLTQNKTIPKEKVSIESQGPNNLEKNRVKEKVDSKWECKICTFHNDKLNDICEVCSKSRHIDQDQPMEVGGAECSSCTLVNPKGTKICRACARSLKDSPTYI